MSEILNMGEHGSFVWFSYGVTLFAIIILGVISWRRHVRLKQMVNKFKEKRDEANV